VPLGHPCKVLPAYAHAPAAIRFFSLPFSVCAFPRGPPGLAVLSPVLLARLHVLADLTYAASLALPALSAVPPRLIPADDSRPLKPLRLALDEGGGGGLRTEIGKEGCGDGVSGRVGGDAVAAALECAWRAHDSAWLTGGGAPFEVSELVLGIQRAVMMVGHGGAALGKGGQYLVSSQSLFFLS